MADSKKYNGSTWEHSLRKLATATDTFTTLPVDVYADGNNATVGISGNTVQNGTPTPDNPIMPQGTGERTGNLCPMIFSHTGVVDDNGSTSTYNTRLWSDKIPVSASQSYYVAIDGVASNDEVLRFNRVIQYDASGTFISRINTGANTTATFTTAANCAYIVLDIRTMSLNVNLNDTDVNTIQMNTGSTALPYEPWGIKIPISSGNTTTPVYLGEVETTRRIGKIDLSEVSWTMLVSGFWRTRDIPNIKYVSANTELGGGIAEKYTIHTGADMISALNCIAIDVSQVSVNTGSNTETPTGMFWYVLATEETGIVNEPLMKIGDYADTVSGITIPTITGKDTFDVETTLKPSEASLSYTGWHDATVEEWDGSQWNE